MRPMHAAGRQPRRTRPIWQSPVYRCWGAAAVLVGITFQAQAAGGHHAVDDAAMLEPGQCQVETWVDRERGGGRSLVHLGPACRVGPVELSANLDRMHLDGNRTPLAAGPQLKWATQLSETLSVGAVVAATWQDARPRWAGRAVLVPVTWQPSPSLAVHLNLGRDFRRNEPSFNRSGAALEWTATPQWSLVAERFRESEAHFWRLGARYTLNDNLSLDLSRARGLGHSAPVWWTMGLNWLFVR